MAKHWHNPQGATTEELILATKAQRKARSRNWALYIARGMLANSYWFKGILSPFQYRNLTDCLRDSIWELEQQYPDSPGPKTIKRRSY